MLSLYCPLFPVVSLVHRLFLRYFLTRKQQNCSHAKQKPRACPHFAPHAASQRGLSVLLPHSRPRLLCLLHI